MIYFIYHCKIICLFKQCQLLNKSGSVVPMGVIVARLACHIRAEIERMDMGFVSGLIDRDNYSMQKIA